MTSKNSNLKEENQNLLINQDLLIDRINKLKTDKKDSRKKLKQTKEELLKNNESSKNGKNAFSFSILILEAICMSYF